MRTCAASRRFGPAVARGLVFAAAIAAFAVCVPASPRLEAAAPASSGGWLRSVIGRGGDYSSLALDSGGDAHVAWMDRGTLRYATNATGNWVSSAVATPGEGYGLTYSAAIAVDHADAVHIAYDATEKLAYLTNRGGTWSTTLIDGPGFDVGDDVAIAVDSHDKVHVSYLDRQNGHLRYATDASGAWAVADLGAGGYNSSIAVDGNDAVHIVHDLVTPSLQVAYTTNASGQWETSALFPSSGYFNSVRTDPAGHVHITYFAGAVYYATNATGAWVTTAVDGDVGDAANSSLVLDSAGNAHVAYGDYGHGALKYATNASGAWAVSVVDGARDCGYFASLAIDRADMLSVTYSDRATGHVHFATTRAVVVCKAVAAQDGWVLESAAGSGVGGPRNAGAATVLVGDDGEGREYRTILTFDTKALPDTATVVSATLKLREKGVTGTDPFTTHGELFVDVGSPAFGASAALRPSDFEAPAGAAAAGTVGHVPLGGAHVADLAPSALPRINKKGGTQLRLRFAAGHDGDSVADCVLFHCGNAKTASLRPVLKVAYRVQ
jgi:hypothetical protein